jgi:drug/metabolite transporter (DMT)-like permease
MTSQHSLRTELPLLALLALLWGSSYLFLKVAVTEIPPVTLIARRVTGAVGFLLVVMRIRSETLPRDWHTRRMLLQQAFFNSIGAWTVLAWGQQFVDAGLASVLNSTSPIFVFLFTALVTRHEPLGGRKLAGVFIGFFGVVLIVGVTTLRGFGSMGVASQSYLRAGVGVVLGLLLLGETLSPSVATGLVAAIIGVALINAPTRKSSTTARAHRPPNAISFNTE